MNSDIPRQYMMLREKPVIYYALKAFEDSFIDEIILVTEQGEEAYCPRRDRRALSFCESKKDSARRSGAVFQRGEWAGSRFGGLCLYIYP